MSNQIQQVVTLLLSFPQMLATWSASSFTFISDDCVGFHVITPRYKGVVRIRYVDKSFYAVEFSDLDIRILGIVGAERVMDVVKDFVEKGEVWG